MNTLPRAVTAQWFTSPSAYHALRQHWSRLLHSDRAGTLSAAHHLLYRALLGQDWRSGFTPPANPRQLANGAFVGWALFRSLARLHQSGPAPALLAPFDGLVTLAMLQHVRTYLPRLSAYGYQVEQFAGRTFPFEAYGLPTGPATAAGQSEVSHGG